MSHGIAGQHMRGLSLKDREVEARPPPHWHPLKGNQANV